MGTFSRHISFKVFFWFLLVNAIAVISIIYLVYSDMSKRQLDGKFSELMVIRDLVATNVLVEMRESVHLTETMARTSVLRDALLGQAPSRAAYDFLQDVRYTHMDDTGFEHDFIHLVGTDGRVVASTDPGYVGVDISERGYFRKSLGGKSGVGGPYTSATLPGRRFLVAYAPVRRTSSIIGMVAVSIEMNVFTKAIYTRAAHSGRTSESYIIGIQKEEGADPEKVNTYMRVISTSRPGVLNKGALVQTKAVQESVKRITGSGLIVGYAGEVVLSAYAPIDDTGWAVLSEVRRDEALEPVTRMRDKLVLLGLGLFAALGVVSAFVSRSITRPISMLAEGARKVGQGDLEHSIQVLNNDETGRLAAEFNLMAGRLKDARESQEARVRQRTSELARTNEDLRAEVVARRVKEVALSESESRLRTIIETSVNPIISITNQGTVKLFNAAAKELLGYSSSEVVGKHVGMLMPEPHRSRHAGYLSDYLKTGHMKAIGTVREMEAMRKDGGLVPINLTVSEVKLDGDSREFVGILTDLRKLKRADRKLSQYSLQLEKMGKELKAAERAAKDVCLARSESLGSVAQEIRTPVGSILAVADLLGRNGLTEEQQGYVLTLRAAGDGLMSTIDDIIDLSRVETGSLVLEHDCFDLPGLLERKAEAMASFAHEKGIELVVKVAPGVPDAMVGDAERLGRVFLNLIGNAIKFTSKGEVVLAVSAKKPDSEGAEVEFSVIDTGIGMSRARLGKIIEGLNQADAPVASMPGSTGLGLAVSSHIVGLMGAEIRVKSSRGKGSTFSFAVRLGLSPECTASVQHVQAGLQGVKVLIADDNKTCRIVLGNILRRWGASVDEAEDGKRCRAELYRARQEGGPYDLLVLDHFMPGMDGMEVARRVRGEARLDIPIIILTSASAGRDLGPEVKQIGNTGYLVKPVKISELRTAVLSVLGHAEAGSHARKGGH